MGVKNLNVLFRLKSKSGINSVNFNTLKGKKVVVDTSIYMYRFKEQNALLENMFNLINLFKTNEIVPYFIFDGKPPEEKNELLKYRKIEKYEAEEEYNKLKESIVLDNIYGEERKKILSKLKDLKCKFIRITSDDINNVKELLTSMGVMWITAEGEADGLCAKMVIKKYVDACLSEDMDMFVYGCPVVWRNLSIKNNKITVYDLNILCEDLSLTKYELREICIVSGTDYNYTTDRKTDLFKTLEYYNKYKKSGSRKQFYEWLEDNTNYIENVYMLYTYLTLFDTRLIKIDNYNISKKISYKEINEKKTIELLSKEDFFFPLQLDNDDVINNDNNNDNNNNDNKKKNKLINKKKKKKTKKK